MVRAAFVGVAGVAVSATLSACGGKSDAPTAPKVPETPAFVVAVSATTQSANITTDVGQRPSVKVTSASGTAVAGVTVTFSVTAGGGAVTGASPQTDTSGIAVVGAWTLGPSEGANALTATVAGLPPVGFSATGTRFRNFDRAIPLQTSGSAGGASLGDLDSDGDLDIVLANGRHEPLVNIVLLNDGAGNFDKSHNLRATADRSYSAALADLDGDGDLDVVVGNDAPDAKVVLFNDGKAQFTLAGTFGAPAMPTRNATVADLNGDGRPDIVVANRGVLDFNRICFNDGRGAFPSCGYLSDNSATTIAVGDMTGDGFPDLVVPHRDGGQSYVHVNDGRGGFGQKVTFGAAKSAARAIALGDIDGDGRIDIVVGDEIGGGTFLFFNLGAGVYSDPLTISALLPWSIEVADLNGDGKSDVVLGNFLAPSTVLLNQGGGRTFAFTVIDFGDAGGIVYGLAVGDVNGDGAPDIVAAKSFAPSTLYLNALSTSAGVRSSPAHRQAP